MVVGHDSEKDNIRGNEEKKEVQLNHTFTIGNMSYVHEDVGHEFTHGGQGGSKIPNG